MVTHYFIWTVLYEAWSNQFILRKELPNGLAFKPEEAALLCEKLTDVFVELHQIDYRKIGLEGFGRPEGYVKRQVEGWSERYRTAKTPDAPDFEKDERFKLMIMAVQVLEKASQGLIEKAAL